MNRDIRKYDPAVDKRFLIVLSGVVWSLAGAALNALAVNWLSHTTAQKAAWLGSAGVILALLIHHFGFLRLVDKNIARIMAKKGKVCIFGFQPWKSYLIIIIMVALGITLRHSSLPKPWLAIIYIGFGGAMLLSSLRYHRIFFTLQKGD